MDDEKKKVGTDNIINKEEKERKKKRRLLIIVIILMFLISFISYFLGYILGKIDVIPTSGKSSKPNTNTVENNTNTNTEINKNNYPNYNYQESDNKNETVNTNTNTNNSKEDENNNKEDIKVVDLIKITENNINWELKEKVNVFANKQYNYKTIVAPESVGNYQFIVDNTTAKAVKYDINFTETNTYNINLKYKLKLDNLYIIGNENTWVDISELKLDDVVLANNSKNLYTLEWKWVETTDEQDTLAAGKGYEMLIDIYAEDL